MPTKTIRETAIFKNTTPHEVYEMLMDSKKHAEFSGSPAKISRKIGGASRAYDNWIEAINLEIVPDEKIVQKWRGSDWPKDIYSQVTFAFAKTGNDTKLTFTQTGVPVDQYEDIKTGWYEYYWNPMKKMLP